MNRLERQAAAVGVAAWMSACVVAQVGTVAPNVETTPVSTRGDAADDIAIWVHPEDASRSLVIGTEKERGLVVYDLNGAVVQEVTGARINNVDLVYGFDLGGSPVDVVAASNRVGNSVGLYLVDGATGRLREGAARVIAVEGGSVYGLCAMRSARSGASYVFVSTTADEVQQWRLVSRDGKVDATLVRRFSVGGHAEGMVADAEHNALFVAEEDVGIWRYEAEPSWLLGGRRQAHEEMSASESGPRALVAQVGRDGLAADVEGLAIYPMADGGGWLLAANQGDSTFAVFDRRPPHALRWRFTIGESGGIDGVSGTDGIEACAAALGQGFPFGIFVAQDDQNTGGNQNFKIVSWDRLRDASGGVVGVNGDWTPRRQRE